MAAFVLCTDLMDRSKIAAALPDATFVRSLAKLADQTDATLVIVDLRKVDDPEQLADLTTRTIAFGSHVDEDVLAAATAAGAEALPRSVFFRRLASGEFEL